MNVIDFELTFFFFRSEAALELQSATGDAADGRGCAAGDRAEAPSQQQPPRALHPATTVPHPAGRCQEYIVLLSAAV